jgi:hypothetical protein
MSMTNQYTDDSIVIDHPAKSIPENASLVSTVKKTLDGDTNLLALQLGAGTFFIKCSLQSFSSRTTLPALHVSYSRATPEGTTTNTVTGKTYNIKDSETVDSSVSFTSNGLGPVSVGLRGHSGHGAYNTVVTIYKAQGII